MMEVQNQAENFQPIAMLPPAPGTFHDREDLINYVRDFGASQGYVVTIKKSRRERRVILGCDRGGVYRNRRRIEDMQRRRKTSSRCINCPFEAIGKKDEDVWVLTIKNGEHNHDALKDISEHPYSRRFNEDEVRQIKLMSDAGIKPLQMLKALKKNNPELHSTARHLYNMKAKIRQGNFSEKNIKSWRPKKAVPIDSYNRSVGACNISNLQIKISNFIDGKFMDSVSATQIEVLNPATQEVVSESPVTTYEEFKAAVSAAKQAYPAWRNTPGTTRRRLLFKLYELILRDIDKFAMNISLEQGKTLDGAKNDVQHGLEVLEHACGLVTPHTGEFFPNAPSGIDTYSSTEPLGVCAGICPFNFPAMVFLWMFPIAVVCGNTFVLKPSEKCPGASMMLAALAKEAGLPDGVLNVVHGTNDIISYIFDDDDIKAISFASSNMAGMHVYARALSSGKRIEFNMGAKNHAIVMPDASKEATLNSLVSAGFGTAGHSCMALSTVVFVGDCMPWVEELVKHAQSLKVNSGTEQGADIGPVISKEVKDQICRLVESGVQSGARLVLDGRNIVVPRYPYGNFVGPTILFDVTTDMECYKEELFGPVILCMQAESLEVAIATVNRNRYCTGASIFTKSSVAARKFQNDIEAGLVGINTPVPIPLPFSSKGSFAGGFNICGKAGVQFYTQIKTVARNWKALQSLGVSRPIHLTTDTDSSSQAITPSLPSSAESDPPSEEVSPAMHQTSDWSGTQPLTVTKTVCHTTNSQREDMGMPISSQTSERINMSVPYHGGDNIGQPSVITAMAICAASVTGDMCGKSSRMSENVMYPTNSEMVYLSSSRNNTLSSTSQQGDGMPLTSCFMRRDLAGPSESLHMPSTSQTVYTQNQVAPVDKFHSQEA